MTSRAPLRVAIFANDDLTSNLIFGPLFDTGSAKIAMLGFSAGPGRGSASQIGGALSLLRRMSVRYWLFLVISNALFKLFEALTLALRLPPRAGNLASLKRLARVRATPVFRARDFSSPEVVEALKRERIDLLVIRVGSILSPEILAVPREGTWCVHSGLLPSFKGIAGEFHALRTPGAPIGSTVFRVTPMLDEGDPLSQIVITRNENASVFSHMLANNLAAAALLRDLVTARAEGRPLPLVLHNEGLAPSYWSWPKSDQVADFRAMGKKLMRTSEVARLLLAALRIRALSYKG